MLTTSAVLTAALAGSGMLAVPVLTRWGMDQLQEPGRWPPLRLPAVAGGLLAGLAAAGGVRVGGWWTLPAFTVWAYSIAAAACCDLVTLRMPTSLLRKAAMLTLPLVILGALAHHSPAPLILGIAISAAGWTPLWLGWRFGPIGPNDPRLALLGGLPLGFATIRAVPAAASAMVLASVAVAVVGLARGAGLKSPVAYGPVLAAAFLAASAFS